MDKLKKIVRKLLPPLIADLANGFRNYTGKYKFKFIGHGWQPQYNAPGTGWHLGNIPALQKEKWDAYVQVISSASPLGINHEAAVPYQHHDTRFHNLLVSFSYVAALAAHGSSSLHLLDWGGGIGHYGVLAQSVLSSEDVNVQYYCYDLPHFTEAGKTLHIKNAVFSSDKEYLLKNNFYELVVSSSSLWYEQDWKALMLQLVAASKNYIYITRIPFTEKTSFVGLQNPSDVGYNTLYYFHVINRQEFINYAFSLNVELIREFLFDETIEIFKSPDKKYSYSGFLFKKRP